MDGLFILLGLGGSMGLLAVMLSPTPKKKSKRKYGEGDP